MENSNNETKSELLIIIIHLTSTKEEVDKFHSTCFKDYFEFGIKTIPHTYLNSKIYQNRKWFNTNINIAEFINENITDWKKIIIEHKSEEEIK